MGVLLYGGGHMDHGRGSVRLVSVRDEPRCGIIINGRKMTKYVMLHMLLRMPSIRGYLMEEIADDRGH